MNKSYLVKADDMRELCLDAWHRGINPYPRLTMDESFYLLMVAGGVIYADTDWDRVGELQRKACGMEEE